MQKLLLLLLVGILVLSGLGAVALPSNKILADLFIKENEPNNVLLDDELDQSQTNYDENCPGIVGYFPINPLYNMSGAQSFTPTREVLTRVFIYASKNATTSYPFILAIRDNLTGENLAVASVNPDEFMVFPDLSWIEFDFDDIIISIGKTYYFVGYSSNVTDNTYICAASCSDVYPNGTAHASFDGGETWEAYPDVDGCFMTYGRDNQPPDAPIIGGQASGKPGIEYVYTFNSTDLNEDPVMYFIEWGDNNTEWTEYSDSGEEIMLKHNWSEKGDYTIKAKAKDIHGAESNWSEFKIEIPRNRAINRPFINFLQNHLNLFPLLERLLNLLR